MGAKVKTTNEVLAETGLTHPMLNRLKDLGIVPKPKLKGLGRHKGVVGEFDDDVIDIINKVKLLQKRHFTLAEIAEQLKQELVEIEVLKPTGEYLIPLNSGEMKSYLSAYTGFHDWIQGQIEEQMPGYEFDSVEMERVTEGGKEFLKPKEIRVRPRAENKSRQ